MDKGTAKRKFKTFVKTYSRYIGIIDGGDGTPVELTGFSLSCNCTAARAAEYGCPKGRLAILVMVLPVDMGQEGSERSGSPKRRGVTRKRFPKKGFLSVFPKRYRGLPVYYLRSERVFAL